VGGNANHDALALEHSFLVRQVADVLESAGYVLQDEVRGSVQVVQIQRQWRPRDIAAKKRLVAFQLAQAMVLAKAQERPQG